MKGNGLELWIASLTTWNFITVQNNSWMLIVHKHCAINTNLFQADTWEGSEGVRLIEVSLYNISKLNSKQVNEKRILISPAIAACFEVLFVFRLPAPLHISPFVYTKIYKPKGYKPYFTACALKGRKLSNNRQLAVWRKLGGVGDLNKLCQFIQWKFRQKRCRFVPFVADCSCITWFNIIPGWGSTPSFKWRGWSNGGENQNPKKPLVPPTKPPKKSLDQKLTPKNPMPNFRALKISREH